MQPSFELRYLELSWYDQDTLVSVKESHVPLQLDYIAAGKYEAETSIYPRIPNVQRGVLAIKLFTDSGNDEPYLKTSSGERWQLSPITDPVTKNVWWIYKERWSERYKCWFSIAPNVVGVLDIHVSSAHCKLSINSFDFEVEQLEGYLSSFKSDLWELILDEKNPVHVKVENGSVGFSEQAVIAIGQLADYAKKIIVSPKIELREVQALTSRSSVKPIKRTFMELAANPS